MDRLQKLGIKSLEYSRLEFELILMYKICHNLSDLQFNTYFVLHKANYNLRCHSFMFSHYYLMLSMMFTNISCFVFNRIVKV